ncbi:hypothetical protein GCM10007862_07080 [Dyella lipolytica]|uniref:ATP-binding protein n=1 Tax=Dyella lipolytica TaxID=1867835 RepID=A0ABW8IYF1_9GAMM|nr:ATP-binding protein [Dyella lipolytica]GLQ45657.1 hypothetical protein GCM10007862_07080 [Dyella lipolytica]
MIAKPIDSITEADLLHLIEAAIVESKRIEYKRELPDAGDAGKVKFLKSVTALANTQGGDLIYGVEAIDGVPRHLRALTMPSADQVLQRLESLGAEGVSPRLAGVHYKFVSLAAGGEVLVIRVAKSWNAPHRVTAGGHAHFYGRNAAGVYPLDVGELRQAFTLSDSIAERVRSFRAGRLLAIGSGEAPTPLQDGARVVFHVMPLQSFTSDFRIDLASREQRLVEAFQKIVPPGNGGHSQRFNLEGRLTHRIVRDGFSESYALLFRNGIIEAAQVWPESDGEKGLPSYYEDHVLDVLKEYLEALRALGLASPVYVFMSMLKVSGYHLSIHARRILGRRVVLDREALIFPELLMEDWSQNLTEQMRPLFDMVWNAFGYERSFNYDANGRWAPSK